MLPCSETSALIFFSCPLIVHSGMKARWYFLKFSPCMHFLLLLPRVTTGLKARDPSRSRQAEGCWGYCRGNTAQKRGQQLRSFFFLFLRTLVFTVGLTACSRGSHSSVSTNICVHSHHCRDQKWGIPKRRGPLACAANHLIYFPIWRRSLGWSFS